MLKGLNSNIIGIGGGAVHLSYPKNHVLDTNIDHFGFPPSTFKLIHCCINSTITLRHGLQLNQYDEFQCWTLQTHNNGSLFLHYFYDILIHHHPSHADFKLTEMDTINLSYPKNYLFDSKICHFYIIFEFHSHLYKCLLPTWWFFLYCNSVWTKFCWNCSMCLRLYVDHTYTSNWTYLLASSVDLLLGSILWVITSCAD